MTDALKTTEKSIIHFNAKESGAQPSMNNNDDLKEIYKMYMFADAVHDFSSKRSKGSNNIDTGLDVNKYITGYSSIRPSNIEHKLENAFRKGKLLTGTPLSSRNSVATLSSLCQPEYDMEYDLDKDDVVERIDSVSRKDHVVYANKLYKGKKKYFSKRVRENISKIINKFDTFNDTPSHLGNYTMMNKFKFEVLMDVSLKEAHMLLIDAQSIPTDDFFYNSTTMEWKNIIKISEEANKYDTASTSMPSYLSKVCDHSSSVVDMNPNISNLHRVWDGVSRNDEVVVNTISCSLSPIIVDLRHTKTEFKKVFTKNYAYTLVDLNDIRYESLIVELKGTYWLHRLPMLFSTKVVFYVVRVLTNNPSDSECNGYVMLYNVDSNKACIILAKGYRVSDDFGVDKIAGMIRSKNVDSSCKEIITHLTGSSSVEANVFALFMLDIKRTGDMSQVMSIKLNRDINVSNNEEKHVGRNMILLSNDRNAILFSRMLNIPSIRTSNMRLKEELSSVTDDEDGDKKVKKKKDEDDKIIVLYLHTPVVVIKNINEYIQSYTDKLKGFKTKFDDDKRYLSYFSDYGKYITRLHYIIKNIQFEESSANYSLDEERKHMNSNKRIIELCETLNRIFLHINMFYCGQGYRNFVELKEMVDRDNDSDSDVFVVPSDEDEKWNYKDRITQRYAEYVSAESIMNDVFSYTYAEAITRKRQDVSGFVKSSTNLKKNFLNSDGVFEEKAYKIIECVSKLYDTCLLFRSQSFDMPKAFAEMIKIANTFVTPSKRKDIPTSEKFNEIMRSICNIAHTITKYYPISNNLSDICFKSVNDVREYKLKFEGGDIKELYNGLMGFLKEVEGELINIIRTFDYSEIEEISSKSDVLERYRDMKKRGRSRSASRRRSSVIRARSRSASRNSRSERTSVQTGGIDLTQNRTPYLNQFNSMLHTTNDDVNIEEKIGNAFYTLFTDEVLGVRVVKNQLYSYYDEEENEFVSYDDEDFHIFDNDFKVRIGYTRVSPKYLGEHILQRLSDYANSSDSFSMISEIEEGDEMYSDIQRKCELLHDYMSIRFRYDDDSIKEKEDLIKKYVGDSIEKKEDLMRKLDVREEDVNSAVINCFNRLYEHTEAKLSYYKNKLRETLEDIKNKWYLVKNIYYTLKGLHDMMDYLYDINTIYGMNIPRVLEDYEYVDVSTELYMVSEMYEYYVGRFIYNTNVIQYQDVVGRVTRTIQNQSHISKSRVSPMSIRSIQNQSHISKSRASPMSIVKEEEIGTHGKRKRSEANITSDWGMMTHRNVPVSTPRADNMSRMKEIGTNSTYNRGTHHQYDWTLPKHFKRSSMVTVASGGSKRSSKRIKRRSSRKTNKKRSYSKRTTGKRN